MSIPPDLDWRLVEKSIEECITKAIENSGAKGVVLGLSGGVDSSVCAVLSARALGSERVTGLIMPDRESSKENIDDAIMVAEHLGIKYVIMDITGVVEAVVKLFGHSYESADKVAKGNVKARTRMIILYYYANTMKRLVVASSNRSEYLLGYFTKWGDAAGDLYPILSLYKTQVRKLAKHLGLPEKIVNKPSTPDLWPGHRASDELGADYDVLDKILYLLIDKQETLKKTAEIAGVPEKLVEQVWDMINKSTHKRSPLKTCSIPGKVIC